MAVGKRRAIDALRRRQLPERKLTDLGHELDDEQFTPDFDAAFDERIEGHPTLARPGRR